ncbi:MAG: M18 family aminopeptidase [Lachnospiraceae bacterium]|nr:M18 family aminopeptidase [Lachnospiraceae bacterium]
MSRDDKKEVMVGTDRECARAHGLAEYMLDFLEECPTAFHAIGKVREVLLSAGYKELSEGSRWELAEGGKYFVVRNESSVIAFRIPRKAVHSFMITASHSDSPAFKLKANPEMEAGKAYTTLNVEKYGGMLMYPWFDRPLSVAGRLLVRDVDGSMRTELVNVDRDLCMIPSLAIHMDRDANKGHDLNPQKELIPILGDETAKGSLMEIIADTVGVDVEDILGDDLFLYARGRGHVWGANQEYVSAGHLDDLQCAYANLIGFVASSGNNHDMNQVNRLIGELGITAEETLGIEDKSYQGLPFQLSEDRMMDTVPVLAIYDNEEVGSGTKQGADSTFLSDVLNRIKENLSMNQEDFSMAIANSFMLSCDNAHAIHPNYLDKADPVNRPVMNHGVVIKYNANQKYTTDGVSAAAFKEVCAAAGVKYQEFTNRSDMAGGSTLGNISNAHVSLNTVDIGLPQLAMHSPYETAGVYDTLDLVRLSRVFYQGRFTDLGHGSFRLEV